MRWILLQSLLLKVIVQEQYAAPEGFPLFLDIVHPETARAPVVVFIHGGGWISGDRSMYAEEAEWMAQNGFAAVTIDYRLAPLYPFPAAVLDCRAAIEYVRANAERLGVDPHRIAVFGNSAGGHLACMCGLCTCEIAGSERFAPVNAVVDVCGLTDVRNPGETQFPISMSFVEQFLGGAYPGREETYALASPASHICTAACPFLIIHGADDDVVPVSQSRSLHDALVLGGNDSTYIELEGEGHSFSLRAWDAIREHSLRFLKSKL